MLTLSKFVGATQLLLVAQGAPGTFHKSTGVVEAHDVNPGHVVVVNVGNIVPL